MILVYLFSLVVMIELCGMAVMLAPPSTREVAENELMSRIKEVRAKGKEAKSAEYISTVHEFYTKLLNNRLQSYKGNILADLYDRDCRITDDVMRAVIKQADLCHEIQTIALKAAMRQFKIDEDVERLRNTINSISDSTVHEFVKLETRLLFNEGIYQLWLEKKRKEGWEKLIEKSL